MGDLFGSLLCLSLEKKIDAIEVLSLPLTPVPLSLSYSDGSMLSSQKSNLMKYLETFPVSEMPEMVHKTIVDALCFFLRLHVNLPNTFEAIARYILGRIVNCQGDTNHLVCDKWIEPSKKGCEREDKSSLRGIYSTKGPTQIRLSDWGEP